MEVRNTDSVGSLHISTEAVAKIAKIAALEIEGVQDIRCANQGVKGILGKTPLQKPIQVQMSDGVAEITLHAVVSSDARTRVLGEKVQQSVKSAVQNMTGITVSRVNIIISGISDLTTATNEN